MPSRGSPIIKAKPNVEDPDSKPKENAHRPRPSRAIGHDPSASGSR